MAAVSLGRLTLDLVAKIGNFTGPMTQAERQAKNSSKNIADSFSFAGVAATAFGAVIAGVSIGGMAAFADQTIQTGSEIKKFAQLSNSSLQEFQYYAKGAETAGIGMESFADKMKDMQDRIGDFQQTGGGPLADFFENIAPKVGVTIQQFQKLSGPQALQLYYDSLQKVNSTQNDMKFYMEAIISDSSSLIPLLQNGGEGFKKWGDAAEKANAIMSDEMIETLSLAKENIRLMDLQWQGLQATLVNNAVPVIQLVADNMDNVKAVAFALTAAMAVKLIPTVIATSIQLVQLATFSVRAGAGLIGLAGSGSVATGSMLALRGAMTFLGGPAGLAMLAVQGVAAGAAFAYMKSSSDEVKPSLDKQGKSVAELVIEYNNLSEAQQRAFKYQEATELKGLTETYTKAQQQVRAYASSIAEVVAKDESTKNTIRGWIREFDQNAISAETLANRINALGDVAEENKTHMDKHAVAATVAKNAMADQRKVVESLDSATKGLSRANDQATASANNHANATANLTKKQRDALKSISDQVLRAKYIDANMAAGWSREKAEAAADYRDNAGVSYSKKLTQQELKVIELGFKVQQQNKVREESEKKIEEAKRKQLELSQKQYSYSNSELKMLQKVAELGEKYNLNEIGAKYGIPKNYLAGLMAQESKGNPNAVSPTGAIGYFQTTSDYRKDNGISVADSKNLPVIAEVVAKNLSIAFEKLGSWEAAIRSHNAGLSGSAQFEKTGKVAGSAARNKEVTNFAPSVNKWITGLGGSSSKDAGFVANDAADNIKDWQEYWTDLEELQKQTLDRQKTISQLYFTEGQRLAFENTEAKRDIELAFAGDDEAIVQHLLLQEKAYNEEVLKYQEAQNLKTIAEKKQLLEAKSNWMTASDYAREYYALVREEILNTPSLSPEIKDARIKEANFNQGLDQNTERENVWGDYKSMMGLDDSPYQQDMDLLAEARAQMLITEEEYQAKKLVMQAKYGASYGQEMTGMLMGLVEENSSAYKAMFAIQKAFAVAQAIMNAPKAFSDAYGALVGIPYVGPFIAPAAGAAAAAIQIAQAASIKSVNLSGMAHDGIDNIPNEGTWLLDKGERVVDSRTNSDLKNYLSASKSGSGVNVNINIPPGYTAKQSRTENGITVDIVEQIVDQKLNNVRRPNSAESSIFQEAFGLAPVR